MAGVWQMDKRLYLLTRVQDVIGSNIYNIQLETVEEIYADLMSDN